MEYVPHVDCTGKIPEQELARVYFLFVHPSLIFFIYNLPFSPMAYLILLHVRQKVTDYSLMYKPCLNIKDPCENFAFCRQFLKFVIGKHNAWLIGASLKGESCLTLIEAASQISLGTSLSEGSFSVRTLPKPS